MSCKTYNIKKVKENLSYYQKQDLWKEIPALVINDYLWMNNNYEPKVEVKVCYSNDYFFVYFKTYEKEIKAIYTEINDPVYKDSCVEFFVNLFPKSTSAYFNFEVNSVGTFLIGFGAPGNRIRLKETDIKKIQVYSTFDEPFVGFHDKEYWEIYYKIPINILENYYHLKFTAENAKANFYKCGDETKYEHYGMWNLINSKTPNFHLPEFFGNIYFE